jgi:hypothetical protein
MQNYKWLNASINPLTIITCLYTYTSLHILIVTVNYFDYYLMHTPIIK